MSHSRLCFLPLPFVLILIALFEDTMAKVLVQWNAITSDSSLTLLAATTSQQGIFLSHDRGITWAPSNTAPSLLWNDITSSADGKILGAVAVGNSIFRSLNRGESWEKAVQAPSQANWNSITCSSDGKLFFATALGEGIYRSSDSGAKWKKVPLSSLVASDSSAQLLPLSWRKIVCDSSARHVVAIEVSGNIYRSSDFGESWTYTSLPSEVSVSLTLMDVVSNESGQFLALLALGSGVYTSKDFGDSWELSVPFSSTSPSSGLLQGISSDASGRCLSVLVSDGSILSSKDHGNSWSKSKNSLKANSQRWLTLLVDATGQQQLAFTESPESYFLSGDHGSSWTAIASLSSSPESASSMERGMSSGSSGTKKGTSSSLLNSALFGSKVVAAEEENEISAVSLKDFTALFDSGNALSIEQVIAQTISNYPTGLPTSLSIPSFAPSLAPALSTDSPSLAPVLPSEAPSAAPVLPSEAPSAAPVLPSEAPSLAPVVPSEAPSAPPVPSLSPSASPSYHPSSHPSSHPGAGPSSQPTSQPSGQPSRQPTSHPTVTSAPTSPVVASAGDVEVTFSTKYDGATVSVPSDGAKQAATAAAAASGGVDGSHITFQGYTSASYLARRALTNENDAEGHRPRQLSSGTTGLRMATRSKIVPSVSIVEEEKKGSVRRNLVGSKTLYSYVFNFILLYKLNDYPRFGGNTTALINSVRRNITVAYNNGVLTDVFLEVAKALNVTGFENVTASDFGFTAIVLPDSHDKKDDNRLTEGELAAIIICSFFGFAFCVAAIYFAVMYRVRSGEDQQGGSAVGRQEVVVTDSLVASDSPTFKTSYVPPTSLKPGQRRGEGSDKIISGFADDAMIIYVDNDVEQSLYNNRDPMNNLNTNLILSSSNANANSAVVNHNSASFDMADIYENNDEMMMVNGRSSFGVGSQHHQRRSSGVVGGGIGAAVGGGEQQVVRRNQNIEIRL